MFGTYCRLRVHVNATSREVIKAARAKLQRKVWHDPAKRDARKAFYKSMLAHHADARAEFQRYRF